MRRMTVRSLAAVVLLLSLASCANAGLITFTGTTPANDNDGTCAAPVLLPRTTPTTMHFRWTGGASGEDSLVNIPAATMFAWSKSLPAATYTWRVWASETLTPWLVGCDTTFVRAVKAPPFRPGINP